MFIEYFAEDASQRPLLLIYGTDTGSIARLREQVQKLASGQKNTLAIHDLAGFQPVDDCQLYFDLADRDCGLSSLQSPKSFACQLRNTAWDDVVDMLQPFTDASKHSGTEWLNTNGPIRLQISNQRGHASTIRPR